MKAKRLLSLIIALVMICSLTACGNNNEKAPAPAESSAAGDNDAPKDYYVAVSLPFTGKNATYAEYIKRGIEIALMHLEEDGGINGEGGMIYIDYYDDRDDPKRGD